jgi:hypothetical protein
MRTWLRIAVLLTFSVWGTVAVSAESPRLLDRSAIAAAADDNMTPYRNLAEDTLKAFKAHDLAAARKKGKELETAWDKNEKALQKSSPEVWKQIDKAMDDFIKPLQAKAPDAAKVQTTYDAFIAKLKLAVKGDSADRR